MSRQLKQKLKNTNLTFEKDECAREYEELGLKELKELIKADRKTEPQIVSLTSAHISGDIYHKVEDEPQTDCAWK